MPAPVRRLPRAIGATCSGGICAASELPPRPTSPGIPPTAPCQKPALNPGVRSVSRLCDGSRSGQARSHCARSRHRQVLHLESPHVLKYVRAMRMHNRPRPKWVIRRGRRPLLCPHACPPTPPDPSDLGAHSLVYVPHAYGGDSEPACGCAVTVRATDSSMGNRTKWNHTILGVYRS